MPEAGTDGYLTPVTRIRQRTDAGRCLLVATTASSAFIMINSVILILLATELDDPLVGPRTISIISLVFQLGSAAIIAWLAWRERRRRTGFAGVFKKTVGQRKKDVIGTATIIGVGQFLTLATLIWVRIDLQDPTYNVGSTPVSVSAVLIVSWTLSLLSETITFYLVFPRSMRRKRGYQEKSRMLDTPTARPMLSSPAPFDSPKVQYAASNPFASNPFASHDATPTQSPRNTNSIISLHSLTLPRGAPTRISASIRRSISITSSARATPSPRQSVESAFDTWDTSSVPQEMRATLSANLHTTTRPISSRAQTHPRLPPIPGSRPVSPAKPLSGPFPLPDNANVDIDDSEDLTPTPPPAILPADTADLPPSPTVRDAPTSLMPISSASSLRAPQPIHTLSSPASMDSLHSPTAPPRPSFARQASLSSHASVESFQHLRSVPPNVPQEESQIHPLFRVTSPEPAPAATPGTIVTAVPADAVRASLERVRMRAGSMGTVSRPGSRTGSRQGGAMGAAGSMPTSGYVSPALGVAASSPLVKEFPRGSVAVNEVQDRDEMGKEEGDKRKVDRGLGLRLDTDLGVKTNVETGDGASEKHESDGLRKEADRAKM